MLETMTGGQRRLNELLGGGSDDADCVARRRPMLEMTHPHKKAGGER